jgi:hypothetical protein
VTPYHQPVIYYLPQQALAHPYMATLHCPEDEPVCPTKFDFSWEAQKLDKPALQRLVFEEAISLKKMKMAAAEAAAAARPATAATGSSSAARTAATQPGHAASGGQAGASSPPDARAVGGAAATTLPPSHKPRPSSGADAAASAQVKPQQAAAAPGGALASLASQFAAAATVGAAAVKAALTGSDSTATSALPASNPNAANIVAQNPAAPLPVSLAPAAQVVHSGSATVPSLAGGADLQQSQPAPTGHSHRVSAGAPVAKQAPVAHRSEAAAPNADGHVGHAVHASTGSHHHRNSTPFPGVLAAAVPPQPGASADHPMADSNPNAILIHQAPAPGVVAAAGSSLAGAVFTNPMRGVAAAVGQPGGQ